MRIFHNVTEADRRLWKAPLVSLPFPFLWAEPHHADVSLFCNTGRGRTTFPKVALGSLHESLAFLMEKVVAYKIRWLAVPQTYLSALFSCQRTATACQPVKANSRTIDFYRMTSGVAGKGRKPRPPVCI